MMHIIPESFAERIIPRLAVADVQVPAETFRMRKAARHSSHFGGHRILSVEIGIYSLAFIEPALLAGVIREHGALADEQVAHIDRKRGPHDLTEGVAVGIGLGVIDGD